MPVAQPFPIHTAWDDACPPRQFQAVAASPDCRERKAPTADRKFLSAAADSMHLLRKSPPLPRHRPERSLPARVPPTFRWRSTAPRQPGFPCSPVPSKTRGRPLQLLRSAQPASAPWLDPGQASARWQATLEYELQMAMRQQHLARLTPILNRPYPHTAPGRDCADCSHLPKPLSREASQSPVEKCLLESKQE
jgi:hypothetical protein